MRALVILAGKALFLSAVITTTVAVTEGYTPPMAAAIAAFMAFMVGHMDGRNKEAQEDRDAHRW